MRAAGAAMHFCQVRVHPSRFPLPTGRKPVECLAHALRDPHRLTVFARAYTKAGDLISCTCSFT